MNKKVNEFETEIKCAYCGYLITEKNDLYLNKILELPFHTNCYGKWLDLSELKKRIKFRLYKLSTNDNVMTPDYYWGLNVAEVECFKIINKARKKFEPFIKYLQTLIENPEIIKGVRMNTYPLVRLIETFNDWFGDLEDE